jgi:hypothetical protein
LKKLWKDERGVEKQVITLLLLPIILFANFSLTPFFAYMMRMNNLKEIADHTLTEVEAVGYLSTTVQGNLTSRLSSMGFGSMTVGGSSYPMFSGSTTTKVLRDATDPTVTLVIKYPAPNITRFLFAVGGTGSTGSSEGFYYLVLKGRSEAYE